MSNKLAALIILLIATTLACGNAGKQTSLAVLPTNTPRPTFTPTPLAAPSNTPVPAPIQPPAPTDTPSPSPVPSNTPAPLPTDTPPPTAPPPTNTPLPPPTSTPLPTNTPTLAPTPEPVIKYVLAGSSREFNCDYTAIIGTVKNANNFGIPNVEVRALGIHQTTGLDFTVRTDAEGNYQAMRIPLPELQAGQWAVMIMENGQEVSERFHWASTPVCQSDDLGHSQVLRVDWKLIE